MIQDFLKDLPFTDKIKAQALDIQFHWVNEAGGTASMTGGLTVQATVRVPFNLWSRLRVCKGILPKDYAEC